MSEVFVSTARKRVTIRFKQEGVTAEAVPLAVRLNQPRLRVVATRPRGLPGVGLPAGGTTGQVAAKASGDDYDVAWVDAIAGEGVNPFVSVAFAYNNVTERVIYTFPDNGQIIGVQIHVTQSFNGVNPSVAIGTQIEPELLAEFEDSDVSQVVGFGIGCFEQFSEGDEIVLTVNPGAGASQGAGFVILEVVLGE